MAPRTAEKRVFPQLLVAAALIAALMSPTSAYAAPTSFNCPIGGGTYEVDNGVLTGITGTCRGDLTLDASVTEINNYALSNQQLTSLTIPASVTVINGSPFAASMTENFVSISVDANNPNYSSEDGVLFNKNKTEIIAYPAGKPDASYTTPSSVTDIRFYGFASNKFLTTINLADNLTSLGGIVFYYSQSLVTVNIGTGLTTVGNQSFAYIPTLKAINVDSNNTYLASIDGVLYSKNITTLHAYPIGKTDTSYIAPNTVTDTDYTIFGNSTHLRTADLSSVRNLGGQAFYYSTIREVTFGNGLTSLTTQTFQGSSELRKVTFGNGLTSIEAGAFASNYLLNCIVYPGSNATIQSYAYPNSVIPVSGPSACPPTVNLSNSNITAAVGVEIISYSIDVPAGAPVTSYSISPAISNGTLDFNTTTGLLSGVPSAATGGVATYTITANSAKNPVTETFTLEVFPDRREVICGAGSYTVTLGVASNGTDCTDALTFAWDVTEIASNSFQGAVITSLVLPPNLKTINVSAFSGITTYSSLVIPNSVTTIGNNAFEQSQFTNLVIGNGITEIGNQVFYRNYGTRLSSITFGTGITSIGTAAFQNFGVYKLIIPEGVTTLSAGAFASLSTKILVLPNSLDTVDLTAFNGGTFDVVKYCGSDADVLGLTFNVPATCGGIVEFDANLGSGLITPQIAATNAALTTNTFTRPNYVFAGWNTQANGLGTDYADEATYPFSGSADRTLYAQWDLAPYSSITGNGIVNCSTSGYFTIAANVVTGNTNCAGTAVIPENVTTIGNNAFRDAVSVTSVTLPSTLTSIGTLGFGYATGLTAINIPDTVTFIGSGAFSNTALTSVTIPSGVTHIASHTFLAVTNLISVTLPAGITSIGYAAFGYTYSLTNITIPSDVFTIGGQAFEGSGLTSITIPDGVISIGALAFSDTSMLSSYTYCGTSLTNADLETAGLGSKTRASCSGSIVNPPTPAGEYAAPAPIPFLKTLTAPKLNLANGKLICTAGTYQSGYTLNGSTQGGSAALFTPSTYSYNIFFNGIRQTALAAEASANTHSWDLSQAPKDSIVTCSTSVTVNSITNIDSSSDNTSGLGQAQSAQAQAIATANADYQAAQIKNAAAYAKALLDNRALWRTQIDEIRANYLATLAKINTSPKSSKTNTSKSVARKTMITAQKKAAADYAASKPAALVAKESANKAALAAKDSASARADAIYGAFIQSAGYGVLVP